MEELFRHDDARTFDAIKQHYIGRIDAFDKMVADGTLGDHLKHCTREDALFSLTVPQSFEQILVLGIYFAKKNNDPEILHDAIATFGRFMREYQRKWEEPGASSDNSMHFIPALLSLAGNDLDIVRDYFPLEKGLTRKGGKFAVPFSNLFIPILYKNDEWLATGLKQAELYLGRKNPVSDDLTMRYMVALANQNEVLASDYLQQISRIYLKMGFIHDFRSKFFKVFGAYMHGLYNISRLALPAEKYERIELLKQDYFWKDYLGYTASINYRPGRPVMYFDGKYAFLNDLYTGLDTSNKPLETKAQPAETDAKKWWQVWK